MTFIFSEITKHFTIGKSLLIQFQAFDTSHWKLEISLQKAEGFNKLSSRRHKETSKFLCLAADEPVIPPEEEDCYEENGSTYRGVTSETISGKKCQAWSSMTPHNHKKTPQNFPTAWETLILNICEKFCCSRLASTSGCTTLASPLNTAASESEGNTDIVIVDIADNTLMSPFN